MSILTEKYRPTRINKIQSHSQIKDIMNNFLKNKNIPNMLFYGPPGVGKTSLILSLAKEYYKDDFKHNVLELNASDERGIKVVRDKIKVLAQFLTNKHDYKIIILDEVDSMTMESQAALRMIMENYYKNTRFCLICNNIEKIINPIISRCSMFYFRKIPEYDVIPYLENIAKNENLNVNVNDVVKYCSGDLRKSINMLEVISNNPNILTEKLSFNELFENLCKMSIKDIYNYSKKLYFNGITGYDLLIEFNDYCIAKDNIKYIETIFNSYSSLQSCNNVLFEITNFLIKIKKLSV